MDSPR